MNSEDHTCAVRRRGNEDVEASIQIEIDNHPDTFTLSSQLSQLLGMKQGTRAAVLHTLWAYIKAHRLQVSPPILHTV